MRGTLQVTRRELLDKRAVFAAALVTGLVPFLTHILPWVDRANAADARNVLAQILAATFAVAVALMYGASCIARDLRERRLSFYFSRPLPAASLWAGKMLAGLLLVIGATALALGPSLLADTRNGFWSLVSPEHLLLLTGVLALPFLAHAVAVMLSSRSAWLVLDLVGLVVAGLAVAALLRVIWLTGSTDILEWASACLAGAAILSLVVAGLIQVTVGRTDARRGHRALSLTLWGGLAAAGLLLAAYTAFLLNPSPSSLREVWDVTAPARGNTIGVTGRSRWRGDCMATFAIDTASARYHRLGVPAVSREAPAISADGSRMVWFEALGRPGVPPVLLMTLDLSRPDTRPETTTITLPEAEGRDLALSNDGRLVAIVHAGLLAVYELNSGRLVASTRIARGWAAVRFVADGRLRVEMPAAYDTNGSARGAVIAYLDLDSHRLVETGTVATAGVRTFVLQTDAACRRMLAYERNGSDTRLALLDAWTGREIAELARRVGSNQPGQLSWVLATALLGDGTAVVGEADRDGARLRRFAADGSPGGIIELGQWTDLRLGGESATGKLAISLAARPAKGGQRTVWDECSLVDIATGARTSVARDAWPLTAPWWGSNRRAPAPGSIAARLFVINDGGLAVWEPVSGGRLRTLIE